MSRVLLDTNVWVSAFLNPDGPCGRLVRRLSGPPHSIVANAEIAAELADVLLRQRLTRKYGYSDGEVREYVRLWWTLVQSVSAAPRVFGCRDPEDDMICAAAVAGIADYLVTRDDDIKRDPLLAGALKREGVTVVSVAEMSRILDDPGG